jgi:hypothetical protein
MMGRDYSHVDIDGVLRRAEAGQIIDAGELRIVIESARWQGRMESRATGEDAPLFANPEQTRKSGNY